ncbi:TIGR02594 family protein [Roseateles sp. P5_D6]
MSIVTRTTSASPAVNDTTPPAGRSYEVQHGDSLSRIAKSNGVSVQALLDANPQVRNPDVIYPGSHLTIPATHYTVQRGDTMQHIAADHGLTLQALVGANPQVRNADLIHVGDTLNLPSVGHLVDGLPVVGSVGLVHDTLLPVYMTDPRYRSDIGKAAIASGSAQSTVELGMTRALNADPTGKRDVTQRQIAEPALARTDGTRNAPTLNLQRFTDPSLGSNALAAIVIGNAEGTRRPDGGFTAAYGGHTDPGNAVHNRGSFSYQHAASSPADADRRQLTTLQGQLPAYEAAARRAGLDPNNARLASAYLDLYNQSPSAAGRFLNQLGTLRGQPIDAAHITNLRVNSYVDASTGQRFRLSGGGQAGSGFVNIANRQVHGTATEAQVQAVIRADQKRRTDAVDSALNRQGLLNGTATAPTPAATVPASASGTGKAARILDVARGEIGTKEVSGGRDNPRVLEYHQATSLKARNDETSWCSSFVNWTMKQAGVPGTNSAAARSWLNWGTSVPKDAAHVKPGDVIVFPRGNNPAQGHVAIVEAVLADGRVKVVGGNQGNGPGNPDGVNEKVRSLSEAIGVRRAP